MAEDLYKVLGIKRGAGDEEIQRAYRDMARKFHPDLNPNDRKAKEKFQAVQRAYEVLSDPQKRETYDRFGSVDGPPPGGTYGWPPRRGPGGSGERPGGGFSPQDFDFDLGVDHPFGTTGSGGFSEIFRHFARGQGTRGQSPRQGRPRPQQAARGNDLFHDVLIPFQTSVSGGQIDLSIRRGAGEVEKITVKIPAGIENGRKIRLRGQGAPSNNGGPPGDLMIKVAVDQHPCFQRRGRDLEVRVPVTLSEAASGTKVDLPTPSGTITLTVPPCTSSGTKLRVKGHGIKTEKWTGDLYAEILVMMPKQLGESQREWLCKIDADSPNPRIDLKW